MTFTREELDLLRQWYNSIEDVNPKYLEPQDDALADKIYAALGHKRRLRNGPAIVGKVAG